MKCILISLLCLIPILASASDTISTPPDIIHTKWFSHYEQVERRVDIYIPEQLKAKSQKPKALYLLHGINGYEGDWQNKGGAVDTLIRMMAEGRCQPMILVMPDCNKWIIKERPISHGHRWKCVMHYAKLSHEHELEYAISDLMTMIDTTYAVAEECAIAGLSDGARIAANVANTRPDKIRTVGLFSPVLHKDQLPVTGNSSPVTHYYIYVGKNDFLKPSGKRFHRRMTKAGYPHHYTEMKGKHTWHVWQQCLADFLTQL